MRFQSTQENTGSIIKPWRALKNFLCVVVLSALGSSCSDATIGSKATTPDAIPADIQIATLRGTSVNLAKRLLGQVCQLGFDQLPFSMNIVALSSSATMIVPSFSPMHPTPDKANNSSMSWWLSLLAASVALVGLAMS
jgi:hypothetical protein